MKEINPMELFSQLPKNRCREMDRQYINEVLDDGFGNKESANMVKRFEIVFAEKFGVKFAISHNSGSGTLVSCLLAAGVGRGIDKTLLSKGQQAIECELKKILPFLLLQGGYIPHVDHLVLLDVSLQDFKNYLGLKNSVLLGRS